MRGSCPGETKSRLLQVPLACGRVTKRFLHPGCRFADRSFQSGCIAGFFQIQPLHDVTVMNVMILEIMIKKKATSFDALRYDA